MELQELEEAEEALEAEFETEHSKWVDKEKALLDGYGEIEDLLDGELSLSFFHWPTCRMSRLVASYFFFFLCRILPQLFRRRQPSRRSSS